MHRYHRHVGIELCMANSFKVQLDFFLVFNNKQLRAHTRSALTTIFFVFFLGRGIMRNLNKDLHCMASSMYVLIY